MIGSSVWDPLFQALLDASERRSERHFRTSRRRGTDHPSAGREVETGKPARNLEPRRPDAFFDGRDVLGGNRSTKIS